MTQAVQSLLAQAAVLERELLSSEYVDVDLVDAAGEVLERGGHVRLVIDLVPEPRLRVRMIGRRGGWWLIDSRGRVAHPPRGFRAAP